MPDLRSRVAIDYDALDLQHIPPFEYTLVEQPQVKTIVHEYALREGQHLQRSTNSRFRFRISFNIMEDRGTGRGIVNTIRTALRGNPSGEFSYYVNSFEYYANCFIESGSLMADYKLEVKGVIRCSVTISAKNDTLITSDTEIAAGPWEEYVAGGDAKEVVVIAEQKTAYPIHIPGEVAVTPDGQDFQINVEAANGVAIEVVSIQIAAPQRNGQSGNSVWRISAAAKGGSTANSIQVSLGYDEKFARNTGSFGIVSSSSSIPLYLFCEETGKHQDVNITIVVRG